MIIRREEVEMMEKSPDSGSKVSALASWLYHLMSYVSLGKLFNLLVLEFTHLLNGKITVHIS